MGLSEDLQLSDTEVAPEIEDPYDRADRLILNGITRRLKRYNKPADMLAALDEMLINTPADLFTEVLRELGGAVCLDQSLMMSFYVILEIPYIAAKLRQKLSKRCGIEQVAG